MNEDTTMITAGVTKTKMPNFWITMSATQVISIHQFKLIISVNKQH